jgi:hypothetical protein
VAIFGDPCVAMTMIQKVLNGVLVEKAFWEGEAPAEPAAPNAPHGSAGASPSR